MSKELFPCPYDEKKMCNFSIPCNKCEILHNYKNIRVKKEQEAQIIKKNKEKEQRFWNVIYITLILFGLFLIIISRNVASRDAAEVFYYLGWFIIVGPALLGYSENFGKK